MNVTDTLMKLKLEGACTDTDTHLYFPGTGRGHSAYPIAQAICKTCPLQSECLEVALKMGERYGVWGGVVMENYGKKKRIKKTTRKKVNHEQAA